MSLRQNWPGEGKTANRIDRLLGHWLPVAAMILVAAVLTIPELDDLMLSLDSISSFIKAFGPTESHYTPVDILNTLHAYSPDQLPLYYFLLNLWGNALGHSIATARLVSLFCGLLFVAMQYRLVSDLLAPPAGAIAVFILLCNPFYNIYFTPLRYYTLMPLLACLILWLYLRIVVLRKTPRVRHYLALTLACFAIVSTHAFGLLLYLVLALYHLLAARKDLRWLLVLAAALSGLLFAAPHLAVLLTDGVAFARNLHGPRSTGALSVLPAWFTVVSAGSPLLLAISVVGFGVRRADRGGGHFWSCSYCLFQASC